MKRSGWMGMGILMALLIAGPVRAQVFGVSVGPAIPTSDLGDILDTGFAVNGFFGGWLGESFLIKGDVGYHGFTSKEIELPGGGEIEIEGGVVPIRGGFYKYWGQSKRFYTGSSLGAYVPTGDLEDLDTKFGLGPRIGYLFPVGGGGGVDLFFEYHRIFIGDENPLTDGDRVFYDEDNVSYVVVGIGYQTGFSR
jgi:hypothetical protein